MTVLPIVDLLILFSWTTLAAGALLKVVNVTFSRAYTLVGFDPIDLLAISVSMLVFAIALIGRQWLKINEQAMPAAKRANHTLDAYDELRRDNGDATVPASTAGSSASAQPRQAWETRPLDT